MTNTAPQPAFPTASPIRIAPNTAVYPTITASAINTYCVHTNATQAAPAGFPTMTIPLSATLVWTDPPGLPGAAIVLVNNLDLIITPPPATTWPVAFGNSNQPGGSAENDVNGVGDATAPGQVADFLNNAEFITYPNPGTSLGTTGVWTIQVRGTAIPQGPQAYSLVVTGPSLTMVANPTNAAVCPTA